MNTNRIATLTIFLLLLVAAVASADRYRVPDKIRQVPDHDPYVDVQIWTDRGDGARYHAGERIEIYFRTNVDAYVAIYDVDTRGRIHRLFPSRYAPDNFVRGGEIHRVPARYGHHFEVEGPSGWETLKAVASTDHRALYDLGRDARPSRYGKDGLYPNKIREVPDRPPGAEVAVATTRHYVLDDVRRRYPRRPWWR